MNNLSTPHSVTPVRGYMEGYYGKLLSWTEREALVQHLASLTLNTFCYAPKEDPQHRLRWRDSHTAEWHTSFADFCTRSSRLGVSVIAGIAPGLDFNFQPAARESEFSLLQNKATQLLNDGASDILILWDDIDENFSASSNLSEGAAHATIVNELSDTMRRPLWTVPRVYAADIENTNSYLEDFFTTLNPQHTVLLCGNAIVASNVQPADLAILSRASIASEDAHNLKHRTIVWDNFYANDYCPRRLFLGPWTGREKINNYLINPTGMPHTDKLLLDITTATQSGVDCQKQWIAALKKHGVPDTFQTIALYFSTPHFGDLTTNQSLTECMHPTEAIVQAIEECLWKWKSPLAREWYPYLFGLKHDLGLVSGTLPKDRVLKTQPACLAKKLLG